MEETDVISGDHKAQLASDALHALVVIIVVLCATILQIAIPHLTPQDLVPSTYGGAIGYAAGRAGNLARTRRNS